MNSPFLKALDFEKTFRLAIDINAIGAGGAGIILFLYMNNQNINYTIEKTNLLWFCHCNILGVFGIYKVVHY